MLGNYWPSRILVLNICSKQCSVIIRTFQLKYWILVHSLNYSSYTGGVNIVDMQFALMTALTAETPMFTLTCASSGGPATTVTWERDGVQLMDDSEYSISQVVEDTVQAVYSNRLSVYGRLTGVYRCIVDNIRGGTNRVLDIQSKFINLCMYLLFCLWPL